MVALVALQEEGDPSYACSVLSCNVLHHVMMAFTICQDPNKPLFIINYPVFGIHV
jgi:hypothetical protein